MSIDTCHSTADSRIASTTVSSGASVMHAGRRKIALVGTPNSGKTAMFNLLTHSHQRVANYSGVTVDSAEADLTMPDGSQVTLVDLPGAYSLKPYTDDEGVLADALRSDAFDAIILVVDSTQAERAVRFLIEVLDETNVPALVAFNMVDLAGKRGFEFDLPKLAQLLGVPVIPTVAVKRGGLAEITETLAQVLKGQNRKKHAVLPPMSAGANGTADAAPASASTRQQVAQQILAFYKLADEYLAQFMRKEGRPDYRSEKIDRIILHPVWGGLILLAVLAVTFQLMFNLAQIPMGWIDGTFAWLGKQVAATSMNGTFKSFLADGLIAGVGGTLVFLPQILILFALILFLEDFGFMARAVFLLDHWMGKVGLHGRAFLPLLSSYACAVPGIMSVKAIESRRDRIITTMIIPLTTCSARIPVYTLLIAAFIPNVPVLGGFFRLQGLVMLGLYVLGIVSALTMGAIFRRFLIRGARPPLLIELPSYKWPSVVSVLKGLHYRAKLFVRRVGTIILALTIVIWALVSYPQPGEGSYAARVGHFIEPAIRPLGYDWKIGMALVPTFGAREVMVAALGTAYAVGDGAEVSQTDKLSETIQKAWPLATGLSLMVFFVFSPMCISTMAAARRQLQSNLWLAGMIAYLFGLAYLGAFITYRLAS